MQALTDEQLQAKTVEFQKRVAGGETLEALLPEAFAVSEGPLLQHPIATILTSYNYIDTRAALDMILGL